VTKPHNRALQDDDSGTTYQVVVFTPADDFHKLRDLLVESFGMTTIDAQIHVHSLPGLLPNLSTKHAAAQLAAAIRELGSDATIVASDEVPKLGKVPTVHHARCSDAGLELIDLRGEPASVIAWNNIDLISVGLVCQQSQHQIGAPPTAMVQLATSRGSEQTVPAEHDSLELLIVTKNPQRAYRVDHAQMNYEYLGRRMSSSATVNFRRFVQDLVNRAGSAKLAPATNAFLQHGFARHYHFRSSEELKRDATFRLLVQDSPVTPVRDATRREPANKPSPGKVAKRQSKETDHGVKANS
jgi:hypothetical protein